MTDSTQSRAFIIEAFDRQLWCPVWQVRLLADVAKIQKLLGPSAEDDPALADTYSLDVADLADFEREFGFRFVRHVRDNASFEVSLYCQPEPSNIPYLVHTGFELPLLLDGRKQMAQMYHDYPPNSFEGEASFDRWVDAGVLTKEVTLEPYPKPSKGFEALRTVFYARKGEEWRIPAFALVRQAAAASNGWNADFERLEGMLYGYERWQIDWWIANRYSQAILARTALTTRR